MISSKPTGLAVRDAEVTRQPLRIVVDSNARTPASARVLDDAAPTLIAVADDADASPLEGHADVVRLPRVDAGLDLELLLKALSERGVRAILPEGGPTLAGSFLAAGLIDQVVAYIAPFSSAVAASRRWPDLAPVAAAGTGSSEPGVGPFADEVAFELGQGGEHMEDELAARGGGVDRLLEAAEPDAAISQPIDDVDQVPQRPAEAVQFPDDQGVAGGAAGLGAARGWAGWPGRSWRSR
jgi:RibD C-terminal domain